MVSVSDSRSRGPGFDSRSVHRQATTLGKLLTPMCLCHQAVQFGKDPTIAIGPGWFQGAVMLCGREGNHRSGVALAMRHRLYISGLSTNGLTATAREMSTPPTWSALPFFFLVANP